MDTMGKRLKWAREQAGFRSASAAAKRQHWKNSTYLAHENGQNDFDAETAERYGAAFNVDPGWLLTGRGDRRRADSELHHSLRHISQTLDHLVRLVEQLVADRDDPPPRPSASKSLKRLT
jgi:transcriptional regulator with XRE-family HTH domain